ncbi:hypothetical protein NCAS_0A02080 [Naumovozyma castellii]|uniref:Uncharacterized protein n=1 Tax=Naumovozyma castellii TaxID=27288 RepID=G0V5M8_NAUCA|nr:hypothetical protein NCAS_0A02080 [Naumovozyma castellii CBS 4309]CCC66766.1 hypothetical protein NCAS_0A02080 [Naumovozyma castellii CBS 4309]
MITTLTKSITALSTSFPGTITDSSSDTSMTSLGSSSSAMAATISNIVFFPIKSAFNHIPSMEREQKAESPRVITRYDLLKAAEENERQARIRSARKSSGRRSRRRHSMKKTVSFDTETIIA